MKLANGLQASSANPANLVRVARLRAVRVVSELNRG
ncbi:MAG: hypothetical protein Pg6C_20920 [Treponemataceae bacterium]|nr:MAG: hypothetical protein Pg6C_20920 [Treponemataceae bacterium]